MIATRTRDALKRAKARGVKLGGPKLAQARKAAVEAIEMNADRHAANVLPIIREIQRAGSKSLRAIAEALENGVRTCRVERPGQLALPQAVAPTAPLDISPPSAAAPSAPPPPQRPVFQFGPFVIPLR